MRFRKNPSPFNQREGLNNFCRQWFKVEEGDLPKGISVMLAAGLKHALPDQIQSEMMRIVRNIGEISHVDLA